MIMKVFKDPSHKLFMKRLEEFGVLNFIYKTTTKGNINLLDLSGLEFILESNRQIQTSIYNKTPKKVYTLIFKNKFT